MVKLLIDQINIDSDKLLQSPDCTHGLGRVIRLLKKEITLYQNFQLGKNQLQNLDTKKIKKVQIGGGGHKLDGFLNIDIVPPADLLWDIREGIPLRDNSCELIFSEHFFEHIDYPKSAKKFIGECFRILGMDGQIIIGVPDSEMATKAYLTRDEKYKKHIMENWYSKRNCLGDFNTYIDILNYHFRDQDDDEKYNPHCWSYDHEKLVSLLENAGFSKITPWKFDPSIANPKRQWGSIYITGFKV